MTFSNRVLRQTRLTASIALILFSGFATTAKSDRASTSHRTLQTPTTNSAVFNLSAFGVVGDGVANDGPAFQRALDAIANAGGGTLFVPAGRYLVATPVVKDFSGLSNATVTIQGVPSSTMPAPPTASGQELAAGLDLTSEIIPATGANDIAFTLTHLQQLSIEHISFAGRPESITDALVTLYLSNIKKATIRHCEFYGVSTFGFSPLFGAGSIIVAVLSDLSIELSVFLGCTANSGAYGPVVQNLAWRKFTITNSIFLDYGLRTFFGKTGLGSPLSWINIANAAVPTPESPRREFVVRDTFLDEGGWVGITALPYRWGPTAPIDLLYISGLKMNVSNLNTTGHLLYDLNNVLIENSHYGWSRNAYAAIHIERVGNAIFDNLTCIDHSDRLYAADRTERLTVINSEYSELDSHAQTTTVLDTTPEEDPVQYVRRQFISALGRQPDPAAHFYWSDKLIRCGENSACLNQQRSAQNEYLAAHPQADFSLAGVVRDENGDPVSGAAISLTGSQSVSTLTDSQGNFRFSSLPTSGSYTVAVSKLHYTFTTSNQTFLHPAGNVTAEFFGTLNRHTISGRITKSDGTGIGGVVMTLEELPATRVTTDATGNYAFPELAAGGNYTVVPESTDLIFTPASHTFQDLSVNQVAGFVARPNRHTISGRITRADGTGVSGVSVTLAQSSATPLTTDTNGNYAFPGLADGGDYTVVAGSTEFVFTPASMTFDDLSADQLASFLAKPLPQLVTVEGSDIAIAFDSVTFFTGPFPIFSSTGLGADAFTRVMVFAKNLEQINHLSQISAVAEDDEGNTYPLEIEYIGDVAGQSWLKQLNLKLSPDLPSGQYVVLSLSIADGRSNKVRINIAPSGSSSSSRQMSYR